MGSPIQCRTVHLESSAAYYLLLGNRNLVSLLVVRTTMDFKSLRRTISKLVDATLTIKNHIDNPQCESGKSLDPGRRK